MQDTGMVRRIDELGRVVIPKEIRKTLRIKEGDPLVTLDQNDIEKQIAELKTNISNANAIAANDAAQKQESLVQNKQDQQDSLEAAQKAIDEAQSDVDKYKKKVAECGDYIYYLKIL